MLSVDPAPRQVGIAVSDEQLTKLNFLRSLYLRGDCEDKESGIGLKFRLNPDLNGIVMKDQNTLSTQFMKILKKNNVKGVSVVLRGRRRRHLGLGFGESSQSS